MSEKYIYLDAQFAKSEIAKLIEAYPDLADDESLRADMVEGETNAIRIIERALSERQEAETIAFAIKAREIDMSARRARFERKSEAMKKLIKSIMAAAELDSLPLTEATLTITKPRTVAEVHSPADLPQGYFKTIRQPDKAAIKQALERGEEIPGAYLVTGDRGLTIRTK